MAYLQGARSQVELFPASIEDYVGADNVVRVYDAFVEHLDLKALGIEWNECEVGAPSYEPRAMLKLGVYGTATSKRLPNFDESIAMRCV